MSLQVSPTHIWAKWVFWPTLEPWHMIEPPTQFASTHMGLKGVGFGHMCPHVPSSMIIPFMVQCKQCVLCQTSFHKRLYAMFNLEHYMSLHWECWKCTWLWEEVRINQVWKWQYGVHALKFAITFVNFKKYTTMVTIACHALYLDPNDGCWIFFCWVAKGYWDRLQEQFHCGTHTQTTIG